MNQQLAREIFNAILKSELTELRLKVLQKAIVYSHVRAEWSLSKPEERIEMDSDRTSAHNVLIDSLNILARNMNQRNENIEWYGHLKNNRIEIAEFACWVHNFLSLSA